MNRGRSLLLAGLGVLAGCTGPPAAPGGHGHVIQIDIDDHGLAGLWMARAPNLKGLIARGTLAFSRVDVPTHSNQNNMTLLTGQYPDGHGVPSNGWLSRTSGFTAPVSLPGLAVGDYALWDNNPLRLRGDSVYRAVHAAGERSAYVGQLPPFELGADEVHLSIVGATFGSLTVTAPGAQGLLTNLLRYPTGLAAGYRYDGPPAAGESRIHFTLRDAADLVRATSASHPLPAYLFVWDFIALDGDPTGTVGADGAAIAAIVDDYDAGLGELLGALSDKGLLDTTNIVFTLDHGKVDTHNQVALGTRGGDTKTSADGQLAAVVAAQGAQFGVGPQSYALLNEDGDALIYARVPGAGTPAGAAAQSDVAHRLVALIQSGALVGVDATRTMTADGWLGTRRFHDFRANSPNQADVIIFPQDDWTLNQVDSVNAAAGPFHEHTQFPYARHGGFSTDELYVPLILAGPAFKSGVLLPHPVEHADVAPTALAALGGLAALRTAARGPIHAALAGDPGETVPLPDPPDGARDLVLSASGFLAPAPTLSAPAGAAVIIDVAGLYDDEIFVDPLLAAAAAPLRDLAARGTRFEDCWTRSRDWPVTEYQMLTGGYPLAPWVSAAEDDPLQVFAPGAGLLAMPPPARHVSDHAGYVAWRTTTAFPGASLFEVARGLGLTTALLGEPDYHTTHIDAGAIDLGVPSADGVSLGDQLAELAAAHPRFLAFIAVGGQRVADRHDPRAIAELDALAKSVADVTSRVPDALVVVTSRGATVIDDPAADFYGAGSSRHVPLLLIGPGVRAGVVSGQPAAPADLPATVLVGLGAPASTDFVSGTRPTVPAAGGMTAPPPPSSSEGHALLQAFSKDAP